jgi:hypothetical protein
MGMLVASVPVNFNAFFMPVSRLCFAPSRSEFWNVNEMGFAT